MTHGSHETETGIRRIKPPEQTPARNYQERSFLLPCEFVGVFNPANRGYIFQISLNGIPQSFTVPKELFSTPGEKVLVEVAVVGTIGRSIVELTKGNVRVLGRILTKDEEKEVDAQQLPVWTYRQLRSSFLEVKETADE